MKKAAIIGAGNLGSRHLQAMAYVESILEIYIIDPSEEALEKAVALYQKVERETDVKKVYKFTSISELQASIDFVVIATGSRHRRRAIEDLLETVEVKYLLLEKFLFPSLDDYSAVQTLFEKNGVKAWVNCPRRMYPYYQKMRDEVNPEDPMIMLVNASNLMVGTHAIHFLDLFCFLTQSVKIDEIRTEGLHSVIYESKRPGHIEFKGNLVFRSGKHSFVFQTFERGMLPLQVTITQPHIRYNVLEHNGKVQFSTAESKWDWETLPFPKPFQSELTNKVAEDLSETGSCKLTPFEESSAIHQSLLKALLKFMGTELNLNTDYCNIT